MAASAPSNNFGRFTDKVTIVTGGCTGIGKGCVDVFSENGSKIAILDIDEQAGQKIAREAAGNVLFIKCDVTREDEVKRSVESVIEEFGKVDCLVNNAGILNPVTTIDEVTLGDFQKIVDVNIFGYFLMSKYTLPYLRQTKGSIVNIASVVGHTGYQGTLTYSTTKGAILAMTKTLAIDEAKNGVRVNSVSPGTIWTRLAEEYHKQVQDERTTKAVKSFSLLNRYGETREVGQACFYLACEGTYCTGTDLGVTGGADVGLGICTINIEQS